LVVTADTTGGSLSEKLPTRDKINKSQNIPRDINASIMPQDFTMRKKAVTL